MTEISKERTELEYQIIGAMATDREIAGRLLPIIGAEDFANEALGTVYKAIQKLFNADAPIDRLTVLQETGDLYEPLLKAAIDIRVIPSNAEYYAGSYQNKKEKRDVRIKNYLTDFSPKTAFVRRILAEFFPYLLNYFRYFKQNFNNKKNKEKQDRYSKNRLHGI